MMSSAAREGICVSLSSDTVTRLPPLPPPYDTPHAESCNNPEFHIDRMHAVGGVSTDKNDSTKILYRYNNVKSMQQ